MVDSLDRLARDALDTISNGYYEVPYDVAFNDIISLKDSLIHARGNPIIAEIKPASPSIGEIRKNIDSTRLAEVMIRGGASGLSVLTEPKHFNGSIGYLSEIRRLSSHPILMKDFILAEEQVKAASNLGASAILLIYSLFERDYSNIELYEMIKLAHGKGLEVLLETHSVEEFKEGIQTEADLIGINNRDLRSLKTDIRLTESILSQVKKEDKFVVSESGIKSADDIRLLRGCGADAFLVGSSIMESHDPELKVRELVNA